MSKDFAGYPIAEEKCKAYGGYLASPKNDEVYTAIKQLAEGSRYRIRNISILLQSYYSMSSNSPRNS